MKKTIVARDKTHLKNLIEKEIKLHGLECDLNFINTSNITDISGLFNSSEFNGNISQWDTSKVTNMSYMFYDSQFNGDISLWNTSHVKHMDFMFYDSQFNGDISKWNVEKVESMYGMFKKSQFNGDLTNWKPYHLKNSENIVFNNDKPYWADKDNNDSLCEVINNYVEKKSLKDKLENKLIQKNITTRKNKI